MRPGYCKSILAGLLIFSCCSALDSQAQIASGSDGGSGALTVAANTVKDLSLATTGSINDAGRVNGTYDPSQWAIVFEYTDVTVSAGTLSFLNHPSGAPVVWLVSGNVTITGTISLSGQDGTYNGGLAAGGPGGFRGGYVNTGSGSPGSGGLGPGGGRFLYGVNSGAAGYGTIGGGGYGGPEYGNVAIIPLIGGSGGSGYHHTNNTGGGGGGGALLIVCNNTITVNGTIVSNGGLSSAWGGSGGAIRLVANSILGTVAGRFTCNGSLNGSVGRIRLEANTLNFRGIASPVASLKAPLDVSDPVIWPPSSAPIVTILTIGGLSVPSDPRAGMVSPPADVNLATTGAAVVTLQVQNAPTNSTVLVRLIPRQGTSNASTEFPATFTGGNSTLWTCTAAGVTVGTAGFTALQARVILP